MYFLSPAAKTGGPADISKLVFNRYGDRYFLRELWFSNRGYPLPETARERASASALSDAGSERVAVAAAIDR